jgi:ribosomal protein S18 acetylase RimI-like enzyme
MTDLGRPVFRKAGPGDFLGVRELIRGMDDFHHRLDPERIKPPEAALLAEPVFERFLSDERQLLLVAEQNGAVAGFVRAELQEPAEGRAHRRPRLVMIHELVVDPAARRRGLARKLVEEIEAWAIERGAPVVELGVYAFNAGALDFYRSMGFGDLIIRLARKL